MLQTGLCSHAVRKMLSSAECSELNNLSRKMIRIMIDTNIFISAILFPRSRTAEALLKSMTLPYQPVVCGYVVDELHRKFQEKFSDRTVELEAFLYTSLSVFEIVTTPEKNIEKLFSQ